MQNVNLLEEIERGRCGTHRIRLEDKDKLKHKLNELRINNIFSKNKMSYVYTETENNIILILHTALEV